jgi:DNA-binding protein WhiA
MSFASQVKEETARLECTDEEKRAELCACVKLLSTLSLQHDGLTLTIRCKNPTVIKMISLDLQELYGVKPRLLAIADQRFDKSSVYALKLDQQVRGILEDLDLWTEQGLMEHPHMSFLASEAMVKAYLRGAFLAAGSVNDPSSTNYHMEIAVPEEGHARFLVRLMQKFYIQARITRRRSRYVVYVKASEQISDFLRVIGANQAIFEFEDVRIRRDFVNNLSRLNNCELANDAKSLATASKQYQAALYLKQSGRLDQLSEKDREMAQLRIAEPDASLMELAAAYESRTGTRLSKSGIRHRFLKIIDLAEKYQGKEQL